MTVSNGESIGTSDRGEFDLALHRVRSAIDAEIAHSAAGARVSAAVLSQAGVATAAPRWRWAAVAATLVVAAGLGGVYETNRLQASAPLDVVSLDPLTFSALAADQ